MHRFRQAVIVQLGVMVMSACGAESVKNPSFENGLTAWEVVSDDAGEARCEPLDEAGMDGGACLRISASNRYARTAIHQTIALPEPGKHFLIGFSMKTSSPELTGCIYPYVRYFDSEKRPLKAGGEGWREHYMLPFYLYLYSEREHDGWRCRSYWVPAVDGAVSVELVLDFRALSGEILLDGFSMSPAPPRAEPPGLLQYTPFLNCGAAPCRRLGSLVAAKSPFLDSATLYHRALMALTDAQERLERLERADFYDGARDSQGFRERFSRALDGIGMLHDLYGRCYLARATDRLKLELEPAIAATDAELRALLSGMDRAFAALAARHGLTWAAPETLTSVRPVQFSTERPLEQLVFSSHSMHHHFEMERCLGDFLESGGTKQHLCLTSGFNAQ